MAPERELRAFERTASGLRVHVLVQPRASRDALLGVHGGQLKIALRAPPIDGEANAALVAFVAKVLHVPKKVIAIAHGEASRKKTIVVEGDAASLEAVWVARLAHC